MTNTGLFPQGGADHLTSHLSPNLSSNLSPNLSPNLGANVERDLEQNLAQNQGNLNSLPHSNPLFEPDALQNLATALFAEIQQQDLETDLVDLLKTVAAPSPRAVNVSSGGLQPAKAQSINSPKPFIPHQFPAEQTIPTDVPNIPDLNPSYSNTHNAPSFYFLEHLTAPNPDSPTGSHPSANSPITAVIPDQHKATVDHKLLQENPQGKQNGNYNLIMPHLVDQQGKIYHSNSHHGFDVHSFDVEAVRRDFPILQEQVNGKPLIWFDNAATTQKPQVVIDRLSYFYTHENSNIHRAAHELAARATDAYEKARETVRRFLNAGSANEIIFVRGTTEGINLIAKSWGQQHIQAGDEIVLTNLEHHANIVPWQQLAAQTGAKLRVAPVDDHRQILLEEYQQLLNSKTRLVAFSHVSNALGTITPAKEMIALAHRVGAKVLLDGAQSVSHAAVDVQQLDCDWFVFSGHKIFGPTGIGAVYGREDLLNSTQPWQGGGNMIVDVTFERTVYHNAPSRFEAGTGNIADAVGLATALEYVERIGLPTIARYEHELLEYATAGLLTIPGLRLIGTAPDKASVLSFVLEGFKVETIGQALNQEGIAVRAGHHCARPILRRFGLESTVRPSLAFYNTKAEVDALVHALERIRQKQLS
ncbi:MAG: family 2A encapsulin nanocompartment cargo protein cysteine desulfurase [Pseudanabaenaceae cyanobacterium]